MQVFAPKEPAKAGDTHNWHNLSGIARAIAVFTAASKSSKRWVIVTGSPQESLEWQSYFDFILRYGDQTELDIIEFCDRETLPYDHFSPHPDISSSRLATLYRCLNSSGGIVITTAASLQTRLCPTEYISQQSLVVNQGDKLNEKQFIQALINNGYQRNESVYEHGEFAVRGGLLDLFPMGSNCPYRIELFDDEVESLRSFDAESQRTLNTLEGIMILPASEVRLDKQGINQFRDQWHLEFHNNPENCPVYQDTVAGISTGGVEAYLPMYFKHTSTLFNYLGDDCVFVLDSKIPQTIEHFYDEVEQRFEQHNIDPTRPLLSPHKLYLNQQDYFESLKSHSKIVISCETNGSQTNASRGDFVFESWVNPDLRIDEHHQTPFKKISEFVDTQTDEAPRIIVCVESTGRKELLLEQFNSANIVARELDSLTSDFDSNNATLEIAIADFNKGSFFASGESSWGNKKSLILAEPELLGVNLKPKAQQEKARAHIAEAAIHSLMELSVGAPVVHIDHGVGRYLGLERMPVVLDRNERVDAEFLALSYANDDKLYVPVTHLHLIGRYMGGDEDTAPLDRLGSEHWQNTRRKALEQVKDTAAELLAIYAQREAREGFEHKLPEEDYKRFAEQFPFEETVDQKLAIEAVVADLCRSRPMDRVVCGDVGFGKTEVSMRAAFVAVQNSKQVMMLVPTTLLAQQHAASFAERFADWPVKVDVLSRFRTSSEQKQVLADFASGKIDILVGTHKLIQKDIRTSSLGLVVIDEEHRFGVSQKEQLKKICVNVDLLTMTATPIPRTLNLAMSGLRDLSIIATPPARRLSVKTFVQERKTSLIKEAILRELLRGGQVFYLHNDIDKIDGTAAEIEELVPEARVVVGHGQMPERELEQVMSSFYHKQFNVLVCTTIIETGIDIPNANTIIIERSDKFGLAQLHQLRGRVGRSHHQAYAYLFTPHRKSLTRDAEKRLEAIEESQDLGSGFMLATHDMEIRGAGELLGSQQSGQIHSLGYSMYLEMLEQAVQAIKSGEEFDIDIASKPAGEINLHVPALIPDDYLPDIQLRLSLYKRIANAESEAALRDLKVEMIDRFGLLPPPVNNLFAITSIKLKTQPIGIDKVNCGHSGGFLEFSKKTQIEPITLVKLVQSEPNCFKIKSGTKLYFTQELDSLDERLAWIGDLTEKLSA